MAIISTHTLINADTQRFNAKKQLKAFIIPGATQLSVSVQS